MRRGDLLGDGAQLVDDAGVRRVAEPGRRRGRRPARGPSPTNSAVPPHPGRPPRPAPRRPRAAASRTSSSRTTRLGPSTVIRAASAGRHAPARRCRRRPPPRRRHRSSRRAGRPGARPARGARATCSSSRPSAVGLSYVGRQPAVTQPRRRHHPRVDDVLQVAGRRRDARPSRCSRSAVPNASDDGSSMRRMPETSSTSSWSIQPSQPTVTTPVTCTERRELERGREVVDVAELPAWRRVAHDEQPRGLEVPGQHAVDVRADHASPAARRSPAGRGGCAAPARRAAPSRASRTAGRRRGRRAAERPRRAGRRCPAARRRPSPRCSSTTRRTPVAAAAVSTVWVPRTLSSACSRRSRVDGRVGRRGGRRCRPCPAGSRAPGRARRAPARSRPRPGRGGRRAPRTLPTSGLATSRAATAAPSPDAAPVTATVGRAPRAAP